METKITTEIIGIKEDLKKEHENIKKQVDYALLDVGVELQSDLRERLFQDWYKRYTPNQYERRTDDNSLGIPLGGDENFEIYVKRQTLEFSYEPTGHHANPEWSERNGDNLISWIQAEHNYAEEENGEIIQTIPSRPFWNNFVDEIMDGGFMGKFIKAMSPKYNVIPDGTEDLSDLTAKYLPEDIKVHKI